MQSAGRTVIFLALACAFLPAPQAQSPRPNVLFILGDDLGYETIV